MEKPTSASVFFLSYLHSSTRDRQSLLAEIQYMHKLQSYNLTQLAGIGPKQLPVPLHFFSLDEDNYCLNFLDELLCITSVRHF